MRRPRTTPPLPNASVLDASAGCCNTRGPTSGPSPILPGQGSGHPAYEHPNTAVVGQFAVHPDWQRTGLGQRLLNTVEARAVHLGAQELLLDTSERAVDLIAWYERRGYQRISSAQWSHTNYESVVLARALTGSP